MAITATSRTKAPSRDGASEPAPDRSGQLRRVTVLGSTGRVVALAIVVALTVFGEFRSISAAIDRLPLLRALDSLGRVE